MSWQSTVNYYKAINEGVNFHLGGLHSAKICLWSVDFAEIEKLQHLNLWDETGIILTEAAKSLELAGADCILICTNTMHKVVPQIETQITIPILHIADATAQQLLLDGIKKVGLLGTAFTMQHDFYKSRLINQYTIEVLVPDNHQQQIVHQIIYDELCHGHIQQSSRQKYLDIINDLYQQGAEAVILGCTEIALLVEQQHTNVKLYDTTKIHAQAAVRFALSGKIND